VPTRYQICCVARSVFMNHHQRLRLVGGVTLDGAWWKIPEADAIAAIEAGRWKFFVGSDRGERDVVIAISRYGTKYLKGATDGLQPETLLALPECR
jgi:hypothetical protein